MQESVLNYIRAQLHEGQLKDKTVLEVGSYDRNGCARQLIIDMGSKTYTGVDLELGPCVDEICNAEDVVKRFGENAFDVVISTEVVEHVRDWRTVVENLKRVVKPGGLLLVTTRSRGFNYHAFPTDYWRYEVSDMREIFADFDIVDVSDDPGPPGVFVIAKKPTEPRPAVDLSQIALYCIIVGGRVLDFTPAQARTWKIEWVVRRAMGRLFPKRKAQWTEVL